MVSVVLVRSRSIEQAGSNQQQQQQNRATGPRFFIRVPFCINPATKLEVADKFLVVVVAYGCGEHFGKLGPLASHNAKIATEPKCPYRTFYYSLSERQRASEVKRANILSTLYSTVKYMKSLVAKTAQKLLSFVTSSCKVRASMLVALWRHREC